MSEHSPIALERIGRATPKDRRLTITLSVSVGLHVIAVIAVLLLLHLPAPMADGPETPTEVELVMEEHKGDLTPPASPPAPPPATPAKQIDPSPPDKPQPPEPPVEAKAEAPEEALPPPLEAPAAPDPAKPEERAQQAQPPPSPPAEQPAPTITLSGTDSPSEARAFGDHIIPASPDAVFHNRPPEYPAEAAMAGEHGAVILIIHISPAGRPASVDLIQSSGYVRLDQSARDAVMRWRFLPAVKGGQAVASDMTMQFYFDNGT